MTGHGSRLFDSGGFRDHQRSAAHRPASQVHQMPISGEAVFAGVLAHRRDCDPIAQFDSANLERREQVHNANLIVPVVFTALFRRYTGFLPCGCVISFPL